MDYNDYALQLHTTHGGKITTALRDQRPLGPDELSAYYSPGVAAVSRAIADRPQDLGRYTWTNNLVAVISDGSAILGLGDLGPRAAMPVMEGKALLCKHFARLDAVPIVLDVHEPDQIVAAVQAIAPSFGAINLEDIAAPKCFTIEQQLKESLDIPVFHDDQHGTAIVVLAGLINALKVVGKQLATATTVVVGAGAAGTAIIKLLRLAGAGPIVAVDSQGIIGQSRTDLNAQKQALLSEVAADRSGSLADALDGADVFVGVSQAGLLTPALVQRMAADPIVFALANPTPEIMPDQARAAGVAVMATGRSDFANQVNNALAFPGIFRGALDHGVGQITDQHKLAAARALADLVEQPTADRVIPSPFDRRVVPAVAAAIT